MEYYPFKKFKNWNYENNSNQIDKLILGCMKKLINTIIIIIYNGLIAGH